MKNKPIFLLEDDLTELSRLKNDIEKQLHYSTIAMASSYEAINWLSQHTLPCAAYILDIEMKGQKYSGIQVAEKIRQNPTCRLTPIIFLTSYRHFGRGALQHIHYYHFLDKPYDKYYLIQLLSDALSLPSKEIIQSPLLTLESTQCVYELDIEDISCIEQFGSEILITDFLGKETSYTVKAHAFSHLCKQLIKIKGCALQQVHRSVIINFNRIQKIDWQKNYATVWLFNVAGSKPVGRTFLHHLSIFQKSRGLFN